MNYLIQGLAVIKDLINTLRKYEDRALITISDRAKNLELFNEFVNNDEDIRVC